MSRLALRLAFGTLCAATFVGQTPQQQVVDRLFRLTHSESESSIREVATIVRSVADVAQLTADSANRTLAARATSSQIALAEWLVAELDQPANRHPHAPGVNLSKSEYRMPDSDEAARVFYLTNTGTPQEVQEVATITRSLAEIRRLFVFNGPRALVLRGPGDRIAMAEWLIGELDQPAEQPRATRASEYRAPGGVDDGALVFYLASIAKPQDLQEMATVLRSIADIRRVFTYTARRAVTLRGTSNELAMAQWIFQELREPAGRQYTLPRSTDDFVRVLRLPPETTAKELQETAVLVRTTSGLKRIFTYNAQRAMVVRGTSQQVATAERVVQERIQQNAAR